MRLWFLLDETLGYVLRNKTLTLFLFRTSYEFMSTLKTISNVLQRHKQYRTMLVRHQPDKMIAVRQVHIQIQAVPMLWIKMEMHKRNGLDPLAPNQRTTKKHEMTRAKMKEKKVQKERGRAGLNWSLKLQHPSTIFWPRQGCILICIYIEIKFPRLVYIV